MKLEANKKGIIILNKNRIKCQSYLLGKLQEIDKRKAYYEMSLQILKKANINTDFLNYIEGRITIKKINNKMMSILGFSFRSIQEENEIEYFGRNKKRKKKKTGKNYFDSTVSSVRTIFNAMGNKR